MAHNKKILLDALKNLNNTKSVIKNNNLKEIPEMKKGGKFSSDIGATNRVFKKNSLFKKNPLFKSKKKKSKGKTYDPLAPGSAAPMYFDNGGEKSKNNRKFKRDLMKQYPGMQDVYGRRGQKLRITEDPNYVASQHGNFGNIEFMRPHQEPINYTEDYSYASPHPRKYNLIYNPEGANRGDMFLDMMHGMRDDENYMKLLENFNAAVRQDRGSNMDKWWAVDEAAGYPDGREQWDNNYIDGILRSELNRLDPIAATSFDAEGYAKERELNTDLIRNAAQDIYGYLKTKHRDGGEYIELELTPEEIDEYKKGGYIVEDISIPSLNQMKKGGGPVCPEGYYFDEDKGECVKIEFLDCPSGVCHLPDSSGNIKYRNTLIKGYNYPKDTNAAQAWEVQKNQFPYAADDVDSWYNIWYAQRMAKPEFAQLAEQRLNAAVKGETPYVLEAQPTYQKEGHDGYATTYIKKVTDPANKPFENKIIVNGAIYPDSGNNDYYNSLMAKPSKQREYLFEELLHEKTHWDDNNYPQTGTSRHDIEKDEVLNSVLPKEYLIVNPEGKIYHWDDNDNLLPFKFDEGLPEGQLEYLSRPTEVRARLNMWRQYNNISPTKDYHPSEIKRIIDSNVKNILNNPETVNPLDYRNILELYQIIHADPKVLKELNDRYVSNDSNKELKVAAKGGQASCPQGYIKVNGKCVPIHNMVMRRVDPYYTSNPNDPRIKAFNDSLDLYRQSTVHHKRLQDSNMIPHIMPNAELNKSQKKHISSAKIKPKYFVKGDRTSKTPSGLNSFSFPVYPSPIQEVIYKPKPKPKKQVTKKVEEKPVIKEQVIVEEPMQMMPTPQPTRINPELQKFVEAREPGTGADVMPVYDTESYVEGGPDSAGADWVGRTERYIDWDGNSVGYNLPRVRKPGHGGDLIRKGQRRYLHLPSIETRYQAEIIPEEEFKKGGDSKKKKRKTDDQGRYRSEDGNIHTPLTPEMRAVMPPEEWGQYVQEVPEVYTTRTREQQDAINAARNMQLLNELNYQRAPHLYLPDGSLRPQAAQAADWVWQLGMTGPAALKGANAAMKIPLGAGVNVGGVLNTAMIAHGATEVDDRYQDWQDVVEGNMDWKEAALKTGMTALELSPAYGAAKELLPQTHKINPFAGKLGTYNRVVGHDAIDDIRKSGLVRVNEDAGVAHDLGPFGIVNRTTPYPSFGPAGAPPSKTYALQVIDQGKKPYIISTSRPMKASNLGRHGKGSTQWPMDETGKYMSGFPASEAKVFEYADKPHWFWGYKKVPRELPGFKKGGQYNIGDEVELTDAELRRLKKLGYTFE